MWCSVCGRAVELELTAAADEHQMAVQSPIGVVKTVWGNKLSNCYAFA